MKYFFVFLVTFVLAMPAVACDCLMTPIEKHIKETKIIVVAQVVELLDKKEDEHYFIAFDTTRSYTVKIKILNSYKGFLNKGKTIELSSDFSDCSFYYKKNAKYLLFLINDKKTNKLFLRACSYSESLVNAAATIKVIEKETNYKGN